MKTETDRLNGMIMAVGFEDLSQIRKMTSHIQEGLLGIEPFCQFVRAVYERAFPNDVGKPILTESIARAIGTELRMLRECFEPAPAMPMEAEGEKPAKAEMREIDEADQGTWDKICRGLLADTDGEVGMAYTVKPGEPPLVIITISTDSTVGRMRPGDRSASLALIEGYLIQMAKMIPSTYDALVVVLMAETGEGPNEAWARHNRTLLNAGEPYIQTKGLSEGTIGAWPTGAAAAPPKPWLKDHSDLDEARDALLRGARMRHRKERSEIPPLDHRRHVELEDRQNREIETIKGLWRDA